ncbi:hypothetical protein N4T57_06915 [Campylobacter hepaticus]|uniref:hypothetical protein n=1 Tax=Campylobacter hepaticus TaxID=1813019 RepID=UPI00082923CD|nr:hypothetical protein [Campylobacter hepaticus]MCZ0772852.1 hypothetical protein [Campylobacter hepaticus]MCZ0774321.1 hypothetical protein [Campylobacter hepaticus]MCZ0775573.1 hypothetical protein [Campylobacter hepaticus]WAP49756.1 hypothetical protein N3Z98_00870 [Campylobacter hepaticus]
MNLFNTEIVEFLNQKDIIIIKINCENIIFNVLILNSNSYKDVKPKTKVELFFQKHEFYFTLPNTLLSVKNSFLVKIEQIKKRMTFALLEQMILF